MPTETMLPEWFHLLGIMGWPLVACSVATLALIGERVVFFSKHQLMKQQQRTQLCNQVRMYSAQPHATRDEIISHLVEQVTPPYFRSVTSLRFIGTISPMLGLLGTVIGIIACFQAIASSPNTQVTPSLIAQGLWEAMLTTALGLAIAVPALCAAHWCKHLSQEHVQKLCAALNWQSLSLELDKTKPGNSDHLLAGSTHHKAL